MNGIIEIWLHREKSTFDQMKKAIVIKVRVIRAGEVMGINIIEKRNVHPSWGLDKSTKTTEYSLIWLFITR